MEALSSQKRRRRSTLDVTIIEERYIESTLTRLLGRRQAIEKTPSYS